MGFATEMELRELEELPEPSVEESSFVYFGLGDGSWSFNFRPRSDAGNLIGSGLYPFMRFNGGEACIPLSYCGIGKYCFVGDIPAGEQVVDIVMNGALFGVEESFEEGNDEGQDWPPNELSPCSVVVDEPDAGEADTSEGGDTWDDPDVEEDGILTEDIIGEEDTTDDVSPPDVSDGIGPVGEDADGQLASDTGVEGDGNEDSQSDTAMGEDIMWDDTLQPQTDGDKTPGGKPGPENLTDSSVSSENEGDSAVGDGTVGAITSRRDEGCMTTRSPWGTAFGGGALLLLTMLLSRRCLRHQEL